MARAEFVRIDLRHRCNQALQERLLGHFQAENRHRLTAADGDVLREIQRQRRFALRRPCGKDNQLRGLQTGKQLVQFSVARRNAGDALPFPEDSFQPLEIVLDDVFNRNETCLHAVFRQSENRRFRVIQDGVCAVFTLESILLDVVSGVNQVAQHRFLFDDARVVLNVRDLGHAIGQRRQIRRPSRGFQVAPAVQFFGQRDQIDGLLAFPQRDHLRKNPPVLVQEEVLRAKILDCGVQRMVVQQNRAQHGPLGIQVIR